MKQQYLQAGEIVSTHGVRGEIKVLPWADSPDFLTLFDHIRLDDQMYEVLGARVQKTCVLLRLAGVDSVEAAARLRGKIVWVDRDEVELEDGTHFIADLLGLPVFADGKQIGRIEDVLTMPAHDVYVVRGSHEYMIPAVPEFVRSVDLTDGVEVRLIEGMRSDED